MAAARVPYCLPAPTVRMWPEAMTAPARPYSTTAPTTTSPDGVVAPAIGTTGAVNSALASSAGRLASAVLFETVAGPLLIREAS